MLDFYVSELSMIIFENDFLTENENRKIAENYVNENFKNILPCHKDYIIDEAFNVYYNM